MAVSILTQLLEDTSTESSVARCLCSLLCLRCLLFVFKFFPLPPDDVRFHTAFLKFGYLQLALGCDVYASKSSCHLVYTAKSLHPQIIQPQKLHQNLITVIINQSEGFILSFHIQHHS